MTIAVIYGGRSGEHEVSLVSGASVARSIDSSKHTVVLIGITKNGQWYLQDDSELERIRNDPKAAFRITESEDREIAVIPGGGMNAFRAGGSQLRIDVAFPVLHGTYGEDGTVQGLFEMADIPYVGCSVMSSALTMDKEKTKQLWQQAGLTVVPYLCLHRYELNDSHEYDRLVQQAIDTLGFPLFVKPCSAGSSVGASKAVDRKQLSGALLDAFCWDDKVLIEKAVNAREIECAVTGNSTSADAASETEKVQAYGPGEIAPTHEFYDYDAKYTDPNGALLTIPAKLSPDQNEQIRKTAVAAYRAVDACGLSRVDFLVDRTTGTQYLNELNSIPGFTSISMFPKMCEAGGLTFTPLTELLIDEAVKRYRARSALQTSRQ